MTDTHYIINRSMRDITGRAISVAASPNVTAAEGSNIYPVLAPQNKIIDTDYVGDVNIMGNVPVSMMNSPDSAYLKAFDVAHFPIAINYRYMAIKPSDSNIMLNRQVVKAMEEALSHAYAETFTDLSFFKANYYARSLGVPPTDDDSKPASYLGMFMLYQTILQNVLQVDASYKKLMSLEDTLTAQAWLREVPALHQIFGLLKKKALVSYFDALDTLIPGNAIDLDWAQQVNVLCNIPSKKSDSYEDPLIVIDSYHAMPKFQEVRVVNASGVSQLAWFYQATPGEGGGIPTMPLTSTSQTTVPSRYWAQFKVKFIGTGGVEEERSMVANIEELFYAVQTMLSPFTILSLCRDVYEQRLPPKAIQAYFNRLVTYLEETVYALNTFSSDFADLNVVLKVMQRVGLNNWKFGQLCRPNNAIGKYAPCYNKLLYDVFSAVLAGGAEMVWDDNSKRWKFWTVWNKEKDMPNYDLSTGGSFLTFSTRNVPELEGSSSMMRYCIPILFNPVQPYNIQFMNREGIIYNMDSVEYNSAQITQDSVLARLQAVPQPALKIKVPVFAEKAIPDPVAEAFLFKTIVAICGMCAMYDFEQSTVIEKQLDTNVMNVLDVEMDDISNVMINQAREFAPFRVAVAEGASQVGFLKVVG